MKRLVIVYNPSSSRFFEVKKKVLERARELKGWMVCKFEVRKAGVEENAEELAKIIRKDDLLVSAGGDGTAHMVLNAIMKSGKLATMGVIGLGNFNDYSGTLGEMSLKEIVRWFEEGRYKTVYPVEVKLRGRESVKKRYFLMYFSVGMFGEAAGEFEREKIRRKLYKVKNRLVYSAKVLSRWYFLRNKRRWDFLPTGVVESREAGTGKNVKTDLVRGTTDYLALNGEVVAGVLPVEGWMGDEVAFWSGEMRNRSFFRMLGAFLRGLKGKLPGRKTEEDKIVFERRADVFVNFEGECEKFEKIKEIELRKTALSLRVIRR